VPVTEIDLDEVLRGELAENVERKDFLPSEIEAIRRAMLPAEKAAATSRKVSGRSAPAGAGETRDKIGAITGVSGRTVEKIAKVVEAAERRRRDDAAGHAHQGSRDPPVRRAVEAD